MQYSELTAESRDLFERLLDEEVELPSSEIPAQLFDEPIVSYQDSEYSITTESTDRNRSETTYQIREIDGDAVEESDTVVSYSNLDAADQSQFEELVADESRESSTHPIPFEYDYVQYDGALYKASATTSDIRVWRLSAEKRGFLF